MSQKSNNDYWKKREEEEKKWQAAIAAGLITYNKHLAWMYQNARDEINRQIKADLASVGGKLVKASDMQEYETLAKKAVAKANELRKSGHHVTRKDFSDDVNQRLKIYNATMRINRNEMLKSKIGAHLVSLGIDQEDSLSSKLWNDYIKEKKRQAGILGITAKSNLWTSKEVQLQIYKQTQNARFSDRIWANIDELKSRLDGLISTAIIRGDNPREMATCLIDLVNDAIQNKTYAAERLARTEVARVQFEAQKKSFVDNNYKYVQWFAEAQACKICREIADKDNNWGSGIYKVRDVPDIPVHPNCMCSIGAYWLDEDKNNLVNETSKIKKTSEHNIFTVNRQLVNSKKYHDKFDQLNYPKPVKEGAYQVAMKILSERNNTPYESVAVIDNRTGKLIVENNTTHTKYKSGFTHEQKKIFDKYPHKMVMLHNHPQSSRPSITDLVTATLPKIDSAIIVGHDGSLYKYWIDKGLDVQDDFNRCYNRFRHEGYEKSLAYSKAMDEFIKEEGVHLEKV